MADRQLASYPETEEEKNGAWFGRLDDNLEILHGAMNTRSAVLIT